MTDIVNNIFSVTPQTFNQQALQIFQYQYNNNVVYKRWVDALKVDVDSVNNLLQIPFLPIQFFKTCEVITGSFAPEAVFESSGTTQQTTSKHFVKDVSIYIKSFTTAFEKQYGPVEDYCFLGLLPSYLERSGSSLVTMVDHFIKRSKSPLSNFYLHNLQDLKNVLHQLQQTKQPTILIGVTFALLDFAEHYSMPLTNTIVMETGGMKGRRKELIRNEVHEILKRSFNQQQIHSEYGMTELLSQAYAKGDGVFAAPNWMKVLIRDEEDPLTITNTGRGLINVIDLANINSCSFIATDDVGVLNTDGTFKVTGRLDNSDIRGCSLLAFN